MNVISAVKMYVTKMTEEVGPGMKVLLMDKITTSIVSMVYSQSEILLKEVYLFEKIDSLSSNDTLRYLKCLVFIRPTKENVALLCQELKNPRYGSYYLYFSNIISKTDIKTLAEADEFELIREVQEFYADYLAVSSHLFSLGLFSCIHLGNKAAEWNHNNLQRCVQGVLSLLLSLNINPYIRYSKTSKVASILADSLSCKLSEEENMFSRQPDMTPVLLILDRRDDPITPLLSQWTYQAMIHELLNISNNRVNLSHIPDMNPELKEIVLSPEHDEFYARNLYRNYGEIGQTVKQLLNEFQRKVENQQKLESISDMKNFIETYPQFKKMSGTVTKHVVIISELSNIVEKRKLLEVSAIEQEIATQDQHSAHLQEVKNLISNNEIRIEEAIRLVILYGLKYSKLSNSAVGSFVPILRRRGATESMCELIYKVIHYGNYQETHNGNLAAPGHVVKITKRLFKDLKGVENIFAQHVPLLKGILDDLIQGKLKESTYPFFGKSRSHRVQDIIVFFIGGVTYEEALCAHQLQAENSSVNIIIGGSTVHNTTTFLNEVATSTPGFH